eukprot:783520_1
MSLIKLTSIAILILCCEIGNCCDKTEDGSDCSDPNFACNYGESESCQKKSTPGGFYCECDSGIPTAEPTREPIDFPNSCTAETYIYVLGPQGLTFDDARSICISNYGSDLAPIVTDAHWECALYIISGRPSPWFGLHLDKYEYTYSWGYVDGTQCHDIPTCLSAEYWKPGTPIKCTKETKYHCGRILPDLEKVSNDKACDETLTAFLCKGPDFKLETE